MEQAGTLQQRPGLVASRMSLARRHPATAGSFGPLLLPAVLGCLKDALWDLHEGVVWGLLEPAFEQGQQKQLLNAAANELNTDKQLVLQLAREHGLLEEYAAQVQVCSQAATLSSSSQPCHGRHLHGS